MKRTGQLLRFIAAATLLTANLWASSPESRGGESQSPEEVSVYVVEACPVNIAVRLAAESIVAKLYARIGVRLWFANTRPRQANADFISLRLLDRAPDTFRYNVLGSALIENHRGLMALVFCDRLSRFYEPRDAREMAMLLGYAMTHEIGHLLEGEPRHSAAGIMKAGWTPSDMRVMSQNGMGFDSNDAARIHRGLAARRSTEARLARRN